MTHKCKVAVLCGGNSPEHEISLLSARKICTVLSTEGYNLIPVFIHRNANWYINHPALNHIYENCPNARTANKATKVLLVGAEQSPYLLEDETLAKKPIDILFPVLHGPLGEDGSIQGMAHILDVPCVGNSALSCAISMDKEITKRLLDEAGVKIPPYISLRKKHYPKLLDQLPALVQKKLGYPVFVKPANMGSSVGISKLTRSCELKEGLDKAFLFDKKVLIEQAITGREIECSLCGDQVATSTGEILTPGGFYDYEKKYAKNSPARLEIPAKITPETFLRVRKIALQVADALEMDIIARIDFFLTAEGEIYVNEVNTMPGFTQISMYPAMWEKSGLSCAQLLDKIITLSLKQVKENRSLCKNALL